MRKIILAALILSLFFFIPTRAQAYQEPLKVFYAGPAQGGVQAALELASDFSLTDDPAQAQVFVLNGVIPDAAGIRAQVEQGAGLVLILGPDLTPQDVEELLGIPVELESQEAPLSLVPTPSGDDPVLQAIAWNSAPQIRERYQLRMPSGALAGLVSGFEENTLLLGQIQAGQGQVYILAPFLDEANPQFQEWAYFNYLIYFLTARAGGWTPQTFAEYPGSPVPHSGERVALFAMLAGTLILAVLAFLAVRRYSKAHPEELDQLVLERQGTGEQGSGTGGRRLPSQGPEKNKSEWNDIGFHRPLGGFLLAFMFGLLLFIPLIIYQNMILPVYILPSAQALGIWGRVTQFFQFLWLFFDMGTSTAFIKYFAERRVHDPRRAILYGQVFVWWQALSGAVQVAMMTALAGIVLPETVYALYAWSIIIHTLIQVPGFFQVMRHALMGWQRFDFAQILDMGLAVIFPMLAQPVIVTLMVFWGKTNPVFGPAMGGLLGLGLAAYAAEALTFLLGLWLYRRAGFSARVLFLAHFDWKTIGESLRFGVFEMLGSVAWAVGQAMEIVVTQTRLVNYTEVWGNWVLAQNFIFAFQVLSTLFSNVMPSISEAISNSRVKLSQYYSAMSYKWGGLVSAFIGAVLLAVADRFIIGASGPEFVRAAAYAIPLIIWGAIQYPSWVGDNVQLACNRPYLKTILVAGEQAVRIVLALVLLRRLQINALIIAYFVGLLSKDIVAYFVNHRLCYPQRFYFWQSLGAPLLAGTAHWAVLRFFTGLIWQGDQITSVLIFLIGILISYPLYAFFYGLAGGWDDETLAEVRQSAGLSSIMAPLARLFWAASAAGAKISPLHGRFPIDIRQAALAEAASLTNERVDV